jgi:hypothetical protein
MSLYCSPTLDLCFFAANTSLPIVWDLHGIQKYPKESVLLYFNLVTAVTKNETEETSSSQSLPHISTPELQIKLREWSYHACTTLGHTHNHLQVHKVGVSWFAFSHNDHSINSCTTENASRHSTMPNSYGSHYHPDLGFQSQQARYKNAATS